MIENVGFGDPFTPVNTSNCCTGLCNGDACWCPWDGQWQQNSWYGQYSSMQTNEFTSHR